MYLFPNLKIKVDDIFKVAGRTWILVESTIPFGDGPRECIGMRLGLAGLAAVLSKFTVELAPNTLRHPVVEPKSDIVQSTRDGLPLMFRERKHI